MQRHWVAPSAAAAFIQQFYELDIRHVLPTIRVPTVVLALEGMNVEEEESVATLIPGARCVTLPAQDSDALFSDSDEVVDGMVSAIHDLTGVERAKTETDRVLATVLFTDIVDSTSRAADIGDRAWGELIEDHHRLVRSLLTQYRGREHDTAGDGFFASFDGPARGVRCALEITKAVRELKLEVRAGLHTGEVETIDGKVGGIAVNVGARIAASAAPSEILVSQTVKDLVAGSGLSFEDAGEHELKGVPDPWHLYRVVGA
jgi:class 3 adenylate cyclase